MDELCSILNLNNPEVDCTSEDNSVNSENESEVNYPMEDMNVSTDSPENTEHGSVIEHITEEMSDMDSSINPVNGNTVDCITGKTTKHQPVNSSMSDSVSIKITISADLCKNSGNGSMVEYKTDKICFRKNPTRNDANEKIVESLAQGKSLDTIFSEDITNLPMPRSSKIKYNTLFILKHKDKKEIIQWCMDAGLIAPSYICPVCEKNMKLRIKSESTDGYRWVCGSESKENSHRLSRSVRKGSMFSDTKIGMVDVLMIIHCWVYEVPRKWIYMETDISKRSLCSFVDFILDICVNACAKDNSKIGGVGEVVEIIGGNFVDEKPKDIKRKYSFVFAGVQDMYANKQFICLVDKCDKKNFLEVIKNAVLPGTTVLSEFCEKFNCSEDQDFINLENCSSYQFDSTETYDISKQRRSFWSTIYKRMAKHTKKPDAFDKYLAEFMWRKKNSGASDLMKNFIQDISTVFPPTNKDD